MFNRNHKAIIRPTQELQGQWPKTMSLFISKTLVQFLYISCSYWHYIFVYKYVCLFVFLVLGCIFHSLVAGFILLIRGLLITHNDALQSVGLLWTSDQTVAEISTWQHTTITTDKHPCSGGIRTHNLSRRGAVDLRLRPVTTGIQHISIYVYTLHILVLITTFLIKEFAEIFWLLIKSTIRLHIKICSICKLLTDPGATVDQIINHN